MVGIYFGISFYNMRYTLFNVCGSVDNIRLWDLNGEPEPKPDNSSQTQMMDFKENETKPSYPLANDLFPFISQQSISNNSPQRRESPFVKKKALDGDLELAIPHVGFTIIPGHHGGMISSSCMT